MKPKNDNKNTGLPAVDQPRLVRLSDCVAVNYDLSEVTANVAKHGERLACPFCGDNSTGFTYSQGYKVIHCGNCGATGPLMREKTADWNEDDFRTLALWNSRISPQELAILESDRAKPNAPFAGTAHTNHN